LIRVPEGRLKRAVRTGFSRASGTGWMVIFVPASELAGYLIRPSGTSVWTGLERDLKEMG